MKSALSGLLLIAALSAAAPAWAQTASGSPDRGRRLAALFCTNCHAIDSEAVSPNGKAPPFADLARLNPGSNLDEVFARGVLVSHTGMPQFDPRPPEIADLLAYLRSVQRRDRGPRLQISPKG